MNKILLFMFVIGLSSATTAQTRIGVKAGYSRVNLIYSGQAINNVKARSDFNAGFFASIPLFASFYLQPEIMYSGQGNGYTDSIPSQGKYYYVNLPILFKYQHSSGLFAETGPQIGYLLDANLKIDGQSLNILGVTQSIDISWVFGLGYKIPMINLGIDARYNLGLTNTINASAARGPETAKNSVFQIDLFYMFKM